MDLAIFQSLGLSPAEIAGFAIIYFEIRGLKKDLSIHEKLFHKQQKGKL